MTRIYLYSQYSTHTPLALPSTLYYIHDIRIRRAHTQHKHLCGAESIISDGASLATAEQRRRRRRRIAYARDHLFIRNYSVLCVGLFVFFFFLLPPLYSCDSRSSLCWYIGLRVRVFCYFAAVFVCGCRCFVCAYDAGMVRRLAFYTYSFSGLIV